MFKTFLITNNPEIAFYSSTCGVDRILVDLEILGKQERQGHLNTVISNHTLADIRKIRPLLKKGALMVRANPVHADTNREVEQIIAAGADTIMLPMFRTSEQVKFFVNQVRGKAKICLLVETIGAMNSLQECIAINGVDEVHIGLNDLHLELGNQFMFEPLINGTVEKMTAILRNARVPFGIGGIARVGQGQLPAELILAEHARLGSMAAILSRSFYDKATSLSDMKRQMDLTEEVKKIKQFHSKAQSFSHVERQEIKREIQDKIQKIAQKAI